MSSLAAVDLRRIRVESILTRCGNIFLLMLVLTAEVLVRPIYPLLPSTTIRSCISYMSWPSVVCPSENEVAPDPTEDDTFDVTNRKVEPVRIVS